METTMSTSGVPFRPTPAYNPAPDRKPVVLFGAAVVIALIAAIVAL
jgi:hypothetical protein